MAVRKAAPFRAGPLVGSQVGWFYDGNKDFFPEGDRGVIKDTFRHSFNNRSRGGTGFFDSRLGKQPVQPVFSK